MNNGTGWTDDTDPHFPGESASKKSNEEIAREVIQGNWENGQDRKNRLASAGYDFNAIQALVNKVV